MQFISKVAGITNSVFLVIFGINNLATRRDYPKKAVD